MSRLNEAKSKLDSLVGTREETHKKIQDMITNCNHDIDDVKAQYKEAASRGDLNGMTDAQATLKSLNEELSNIERIKHDMKLVHMTESESEAFIDGITKEYETLEADAIKKANPLIKKLVEIITPVRELRYDSNQTIAYLNIEVKKVGASRNIRTSELEHLLLSRLEQYMETIKE